MNISSYTMSLSILLDLTIFSLWFLDRKASDPTGILAEISIPQQMRRGAKSI